MTGDAPRPAFPDRFIATFAPVSVRFGPGARRDVGEAIEALGARRALVLSTPSRRADAEALAQLIGERAVGVLASAVMHTPVEVSEAAAAHAGEVGADLLIAQGGGSTIGLSKAIAHRTGLPQIAIPTTYAGSEATPILGETREGVKTTLRAPLVQPGTVIYDAELVAGLPAALTVTSAMNAMAHAAEALYAPDRNPIASALAMEGLAAFRSALPRVRQAPGDLNARGQTLCGAFLCGLVLGQVGMGLHHKLCHTLGGALGLPHAETHAIVLPHALAYNEVAADEWLAPMRALFGGGPLGEALHAFAKENGAPTALKSLGVREADLDHAAALATQTPYPNPAPITREGIRNLLQHAFDGAAPSA